MTDNQCAPPPSRPPAALRPSGLHCCGAPLRPHAPIALPRRYAFPLNLPATWLGLPAKINLLPASSEGGAGTPSLPWGREFEHTVLTAKASKESMYQEAAFYHR